MTQSEDTVQTVQPCDWLNNSYGVRAGGDTLCVSVAFSRMLVIMRINIKVSMTVHALQNGALSRCTESTAVLQRAQ